MGKQRKRYSAQFKFQVALEAAKEARTLNELASLHGVYPNQTGQWKHLPSVSIVIFVSWPRSGWHYICV